MATPAEVWEYDWEGTAPMGNMYNCNIAQYKGIADLLNKVEALTAKVNALTGKVDKISVGGVDTKAVAKAVWDEGAGRMKA